MMELLRATPIGLAFAAALALGGSLPGAARAEEGTPAQASIEPAPSTAPARAIPPITIRFSVALASEEEGTVDPAAQDIFEHLPAKYRSVRMLDERTISALFGEQAHVPLPTGGDVVLLPIAVYGGQLHMQLELPEVVHTSMRMANSRAFYVGGVAHDGGTLIFKLVPEFGAYIEPPAAAPPTPPDTVKATDRR